MILTAALIVQSCLSVVFLTLWLRLRYSPQKKVSREVERVKKRVSKIPFDALPQWAEQALGETGRSFSAWRRSDEEIFLDEASIGAEALSTVLERLRQAKLPNQ